MYWHIFDNKRLGYNPYNYRLNPNASEAETTTTNHVDLLSNGFKIKTDQQQFGTNGANYIYMAFAEEPLVSSNKYSSDGDINYEEVKVNKISPRSVLYYSW